jgi:hypothetical protein
MKEEGRRKKEEGEFNEGRRKRGSFKLLFVNARTVFNSKLKT